MAHGEGDGVRYRLDPTWWRHTHDSGETVVAGSPVRIFRLTSAASRFLDDLQAGKDVDSTTAELQSRLVGAGAIHPDLHEWSMGTADPTLADVTVVIPARVDDGRHVTALVESLPDVARILVIDDGSPQPIGGIARARVLRNDESKGPAAARNLALDLVTTDFVLFLDSDITLPVQASTEEFWRPLMIHMADLSMALVAPRVRSRPGPTVLERYEVDHSPLDMGSEPARVAVGSRLAYVPSAALLARTRVLREVGGFDERLRYGEDVDLVWRINDAGHICRYEPMVEVLHEPRSDWRGLIEQRFMYGTAAAHLESRHPGSARPLRINPWSAVTILAAVTGHPFVAGAIATSTIVRLARRLRSLPDRWKVALRLAGRGHLFAGRMTLEAALRTWWPFTVTACALSRRFRTLIGGYLLVRSIGPLLPERISSQSHQPCLDPLRTSCVRLVDDLAYGTGVWFAAFESSNFDCLTPRFD